MSRLLSAPFSVLILCVALFSFAQAADTLDDFPRPLGASWGQIYLSDSSANAIAAIPGGYVTVGRQTGAVGPALDYWATLVQWDLAGNVARTKTFDTETDHNEALDILPSYGAGGTLEGFMVAGSRHHFYVSPEGHEYYNPYMWLMRTDSSFEKQWEGIYGDYFNDQANSVALDGGGFILGGAYSNGANSGYLLRADGTGARQWQISLGPNDADWYVHPEINDARPTSDGGYILATDNGLYKLSAATPPALQWTAGPDNYQSVIIVSDGYIATGAADIDASPDHTDLVLIKINFDGTQAWRRTFGRAAPALGAEGLNDIGRQVIATSDGGLAIVGTTASYAWHGGTDMWVLKTDSSGNLSWDAVLGDAGNDTGRGIVQDAAGDLVATGGAEWDGHYWIYIVKLSNAYQPPMPTFAYSPVSPFYIQSPVAFNATASSDPDGAIILYEWDFGDGQSGTGMTAEHTYIAPGDYTVTLYVTDNHGIRRETSQTVTAIELDLQWERFFGDGRDWGHDLIRTPEGGFLISGINCTTGVYCNWWVLKLDSLGQVIWQRTYPDVNGRNDGARKAIVGHDGHFIVAGFREKGDGGATRDMRLLKLDSEDGDILWESFLDMGDYDDAFDLKPIPTGGYIVTGSGAGAFGAEYIDARLIQIDESGNAVWSQTYSNTGSLALRGLAVTPTFDGGHAMVCGQYDSFSAAPLMVIKSDAAGTELWRRTIANTARATGGRWIHETPERNLTIAGTLNDQYAMIQLDDDGSVNWIESWGTEYDRDYIDGAHVTPDGGYALTGTQFRVISEADRLYTDDLYIARTDSQGHLAWSRTLGSETSEEGGQAIVYLEDGSVVVLASNSAGGGTWLLKLGGNQPPAGDFTYAPAAPIAGALVTFNADVADSDGTIAQLVWRFGAGQGEPVVTTATSVSHTYAAAGTYTVTLTVIDNQGGEFMVAHTLTVAPGGGGDLCPTDPAKTDPGICGCGVADVDSDGDTTLDCLDGCPLDAQNDADSDTICGNVDNCPAVANPLQENMDGDSLGNGCDSDADGDGYDSVLFGGQDANDTDATLNPDEEQGPAGGVPEYDGNGDGIADGLQTHVVSLHSFDSLEYVTLAGPDGAVLSNVSADGNPSPADAPAEIDFPLGFFSFTLSGVAPGASTTVTIHLPDGVAVESYYKYGPTPSNPAPHWYEFLFDGITGAEISGNTIILHFADGLRGDDDLDATNGMIVDIGGPAVAAAEEPQDNGGGGGDGGGGGGGGCFIGTVAKSYSL